MLLLITRPVMSDAHLLLKLVWDEVKAGFVYFRTIVI